MVIDDKDEGAKGEKPPLRPEPPRSSGPPVTSAGRAVMSEDVPAPPLSEGVYVPNEIILYGVNLEEIVISKEEVPRSKRLTLGVQLFQGGVLQEPSHYSLAAIYSYAFEGHCYRMDRPRIFLISDVPA